MDEKTYWKDYATSSHFMVGIVIPRLNPDESFISLDHRHSARAISVSRPCLSDQKKPLMFTGCHLWVIKILTVCICCGEAYSQTKFPIDQAIASESASVASDQGAHTLLLGATKLNSDDSAPVPVTYCNEELNFTFTLPDNSWQIVDAKIRPSTQLTVIHANPELYCTIEAESFDWSPGLTPNQCIEILKAGARDSGIKMEVLSVEDRSVDGVPGRILLSKTEIKTIKFAYIYWIGTHDGTLYVFNMWSHRHDGGELLAASKILLNGFRVINH